MTAASITTPAVEFRALRKRFGRLTALDAVDIPGSSRRWRDELRDGVAIDRLRARYVLATYGAVLAHLAGDPTTAERSADTAAQLLDDARTVVARRHADLHGRGRQSLANRAAEIKEAQGSRRPIVSGGLEQTGERHTVVSRVFARQPDRRQQKDRRHHEMGVSPN